MEHNEFNDFVNSFNEDKSEGSNEFMNDFNDFENTDRDDSSDSSNSSSVTKDEEVSEVKLGRGATAAIIIALLIILMIVLVTLKSCSVQKKVNSTVSVTSANTGMITKEKVSQNVIDNNQNNTNSVAVSSEVVTTSPENSSVSLKETTISDAPKTQIEGSSNSNLQEVPEASLSASITTSGIVVSKKVYFYNDCYIYGLHLSILKDDATVPVVYFCPKKTYDALNSADAITVEYQVDNKGAVSVTSISK